MARSLGYLQMGATILSHSHIEMKEFLCRFQCEPLSSRPFNAEAQAVVKSVSL